MEYQYDIVFLFTQNGQDLFPCVTSCSEFFKFLPRMGEFIDVDIFDERWCDLCHFEQGSIEDFIGIEEFVVEKVSYGYDGMINSDSQCVKYRIDLSVSKARKLEE